MARGGDDWENPPSVIVFARSHLRQSALLGVTASGVMSPCLTMRFNANLLINC
jgi:hypothetical protein